MAQILPFTRHQAAFDPEAATALGAAYDKAIAGLDEAGPPKIVHEIIAKRIVALATKGERDPQRLCEAALRGLQFGDSSTFQNPSRRRNHARSCSESDFELAH